MLRVIERLQEVSFAKPDEFEQAEYLRREFFRKAGDRCCLWIADGRCVSMLRLEPWRDGLLLTGLETLPEDRNHGYAAALLTAVGEYLSNSGVNKVYSHIDHRNRLSIRVHEKCGFRRIADTATLLDGTVTTRMGTYLLQTGKEWLHNE